MRFIWGIILFTSINSSSQIINLEHPTKLSIPDIKQKCNDKLLKDFNCWTTRRLNNSCLKLNKQDTFLLFYPYEAYYQDSYLFVYWKKGDSAHGTVYYDKGFTKPLAHPSLGAEWEPGNVKQYSSSILHPINMKDLLETLNDTILRTIDTTFYISHSPDLFFSFYFGENSIHRAVHSIRALRSTLITKLKDQLWLLEKKLPDGR